MTFTIGIFAPSTYTDPDKIAAGKDWLEQNGVQVFLHPQITARTQGTAAGTPAQRAQALHDLVQDKSVDAIILARGGNNCMEMLPHINWDILRQNQKPIMGFSDGTALLMAMAKNKIGGAWHGPTLHSFGPSGRVCEADKHSALAALRGEKIAPLHAEFTGPYVGGNLSLTTALCGTQFMPEFINKVLVIEDLADEASRFDRMLQTLKLAGHLDKLKAVLVGNMQLNPETGHTPFGLDFPEILRRKLPANTPVLFDQAFGHADRLHPFEIS